MKVIGIIGPKAAGKETAAKYIAQKYAGKAHSHSEILDEILSILHIPNTRMNLISLVALRKTFGENILVKALNKKIVAENAAVEVITGIRFENELQNIKSYPDALVMYIDAPLEKRYQRQKERIGGKSDDSALSLDEFTRQESEETEVGIKKLGEQADIKIENAGTEQELFDKIDQELHI